MKKVAIVFSAFVAIVVGALFFYNLTKSELDIRISAPSNSDDSYIERLSITHGTKTYSNEVYAQTAEVTDTFGEYRVDLRSKINAPYHIEIEVYFEDGKTIIKDIGSYTDENGVLQNYEHEFVFDFIFTEKVVYPE